MEFKRSRLKRMEEREITRKTVFLGSLTVLLFILILVLGVPFLIRFAIFLGESKRVNPKEQQENILPPLPPRLSVPFEATNSADMKILGFAEPESRVELLQDDIVIDEGNVGSDGEFNFENITLAVGENSFSARAIRESGESSELSKNLVVIYDNNPPSLSMSNPGEDSLTVDYSDFDIIGKSEPGVSVLINGRVALVDDEGVFKLKTQLAPGNNEIEVVVRDLAGNESRKSISIRYNN